MNKYIVVGNPIEHSLSPKLHNFWIKQNKLNAQYKKELLQKSDVKDLISRMRSKEINGANITVPFKKEIIDHLDELSPDAKHTNSVNTVINENGILIGHNTDIAGFELSIRNVNYDLNNKDILIIGAGGVVPSIIFALNKFKVKKIKIMNRTHQNAKLIKKKFNDIEIIEWGDNCTFDMVINATTLGLNKSDEININYEKSSEKKFFYDVIYNPTETNFLKKARENMQLTENGKMMFIYQAHQSFTLWHKIMPIINDEIKDLIK